MLPLLVIQVLMMSSLSSAETAPAWSTQKAASSQYQGLSALDQALLTKPVQSVIDLTNQERTSRGLSPLKFDPHCTRAARDHAKDSAKNRLRGHVGSDGSQPHERYKRYSNNFSMISENWAMLGDDTGQTLTPRKLVQAWMNSPSHKANILDPTAKGIGVGLYRAGIELIGVQCFSAPAQ